MSSSSTHITQSHITSSDTIYKVQDRTRRNHRTTMCSDTIYKVPNTSITSPTTSRIQTTSPQKAKPILQIVSDLKSYIELNNYISFRYRIGVSYTRDA